MAHFLQVSAPVSLSSGSPGRAELSEAAASPARPERLESPIPSSSCFIFLLGTHHPPPACAWSPSLQGPGLCLCQALLTPPCLAQCVARVDTCPSVSSDCVVSRSSPSWGCIVLSLWFYFVSLKGIFRELIITKIQVAPRCSESPFSGGQSFHTAAPGSHCSRRPQCHRTCLPSELCPLCGQPPARLFPPRSAALHLSSLHDRLTTGFGDDITGMLLKVGEMEKVMTPTSHSRPCSRALC